VGRPHIALSAPLTGNFAEYGQNFQKAIDLAVEWINAAGGVKGRPLVIVAGDSKADPKEAAALAQKFTSDSRIVAEIGDFSSTACLAAQPIYDRAGSAVADASHPNFAPGSVWSFGIVAPGWRGRSAWYAVQKLGKRIAVFHNNDWGIASRTSSSTLARWARGHRRRGLLRTDKDFTGVLTSSGLFDLLVWSFTTGALMLKRDKPGWTDVAVMAPGSLLKPLELGGASVNGFYQHGVLPKDPPEVQKFVKGIRRWHKARPTSSPRSPTTSANCPRR
jgi:branched-chain amino acid transport system substrate-binding protein